MQAKMEPGNVNLLQLSPSVQATRSNYTRVHKGKLPKHLEYFLDDRKARIIIDQLQTEQTGRFLRKRNRNMVVEIDGETVPDEDFFWLSLGQITQLLAIDNFVNMDARSVLSCIPPPPDGPDPKLPSGREYRDLDQLRGWFKEMKTKYRLRVEQIPLDRVTGWVRGEREIAHESKPFFTVNAVSVRAARREVGSWTQPLMKDLAPGLIGFLMQKINGTRHFLIQAKVEPGNLDAVDMAPTVSCSRADYLTTRPDRPRFFDRFRNAAPADIRHCSRQSEEGGRFYHLQNKYMIVEIPESEPLDIPPEYIWMTRPQMMEFAKNGSLNVEARTLLSFVNLCKPQEQAQ
jgi:oxidase EvaA